MVQVEDFIHNCESRFEAAEVMEKRELLRKSGSAVTFPLSLHFVEQHFLRHAGHLYPNTNGKTITTMAPHTAYTGR